MDQTGILFSSSAMCCTVERKNGVERSLDNVCLIVPRSRGTNLPHAFLATIFQFRSPAISTHKILHAVLHALHIISVEHNCALRILQYTARDNYRPGPFPSSGDSLDSFYSVQLVKYYLTNYKTRKWQSKALETRAQKLICEENGTGLKEQVK